MSNEQAFLVAQMVKNLNAMWEIWVQSWVRKNTWKGEWLLTPVFLPREFHGQRSLVSYGPWGRKESDKTERLTLSLGGAVRGHLMLVGVQ